MLSITHEPVPSLKWPRMTMQFVPANETIRAAARTGTTIRFEFVERQPGEWVITMIEPAAGSPAKPAVSAKAAEHKP
jgi:Cu/Ag efflux protein CusF